jgi:hypothetical protein
MIRFRCIQQLLPRTALAGLAFLLCLRTCPVGADETDNFYLPLDKELADLGPFLEAANTIALEEAVAEVNLRIEQALRIEDGSARARRLQELHDPLALANAFVRRFGHPRFEDSQMDRALGGSWARQSFAGRRSSSQDLWMNFAAHFPLDLRRWMMLLQNPTVKACGVYFSGDKIVHFHHIGLDYYRRYRSLLQKGLSPEAAYGKVIKHFGATGFWSEELMFGLVATGVYSNADMAANHAGFKFFMNLTDKVRLKGVESEPLLVRSGVFWRLNRHVRPRSGWFAAFISDHWNEALNPNRYDFTMRPGVRCILRSRANAIVTFYTQKDNRPDDAEYFNTLARELSNYYGEPYGHSGQVDTLMTIGNTCFPVVRAAAAKGPSH